jgi:hypothetical protein
MEITSLPDGLALSLTKEFRVPLEAESLRYCLRKIHVLEEEEEATAYNDVQGWVRGGAETFIAIADVYVGQEIRTFVGKALVSFAMTPSDRLDVWLTRRQLLSSKGILTPKVFSAINGTFYEDFISDSLPNADRLSNTLLMDLGRMAAVLDYLGFRPLNFIRDVRVKDGHAYYIDFGSDLGGPESRQEYYAIKEVKRRVSDVQFQSVEQAYFATMRDL